MVLLATGREKEEHKRDPRKEKNLIPSWKRIKFDGDRRYRNRKWWNKWAAKGFALK